MWISLVLGGKAGKKHAVSSFRDSRFHVIDYVWETEDFVGF
jgi:hypothetical protein